MKPTAPAGQCEAAAPSLLVPRRPGACRSLLAVAGLGEGEPALRIGGRARRPGPCGVVALERPPHGILLQHAAAIAPAAVAPGDAPRLGPGLGRPAHRREAPLRLAHGRRVVHDRRRVIAALT